MNQASQIETAIIEAITEATAITGCTWYQLVGLREDLWRFRRDAVDQALIQLAVAGRLNLIPESNQKTLTDAQRRAAVRHGNQDKHLVCLL